MGGLALTGVAVVVLLVFSVLLLRGGWCVGGAGAELLCCGDFFDVPLLVDPVAGNFDGLGNLPCRHGGIGFDNAKACLSWAASSAWRTSSSGFGTSTGVLSGWGTSVSESSDANNEAVGTGIGAGWGACAVPGVAVLEGDLMISSVPASLQMGWVIGSLANSSISCLICCTWCWSAT